MTDGDDEVPFKESLRKALVDAIEADQHRHDPAGSTHGDPRRPRSRIGLRGSLLGAAAVVVAVIFFGLQVLSPGSDDGVQKAIDDLKRAAEATPVEPAAGGYVYSKVTYEAEIAMLGPGGSVAYTVLVPVDQERWVAADGSGRERITQTGAVRFSDPSARAKWEADGSPVLFQDSDDVREPGRLTVGVLSVDQFLALPTDPAALRAELEDLVASSELSGGGSVSYDMLDAVVSGLLWLNPQPELRAALFVALGQQPGIEVRRDVVDELGRDGIALWVRDRGVRTELVVDPATAEVLAVYKIVEDPEQAPRQESVRLTLTQTGVVEGNTETP